MNDWKKQLDLLVEQTNAFVQAVGASAPVTITIREIVAPVVATPSIPTSAHLATEMYIPKEGTDMERAAILRRVTNFKANQKKFQQEREEYYSRTMANARASQCALKAASRISCY